MGKHEEHIIAVFANKYNKIAKEKPQPGNIYDTSLFKKAISQDDVIISQRKKLEEEEQFRQLIPYIYLVTEDKKYLTYERTQKGNEERLHKKISVGFGGHMDANDAEFDENNILNIDLTIKNAIKREVIEELGQNVFSSIEKYLNDINIKKLIIDDTTQVEKVHMALLININIEEIKIESNDESLKIKGFLTKEDIENLEEDIEPWTKAVINIK